MTSVSTPTFMQKITQLADNQQYEAAYQYLLSEQKKLFESEADKALFREKGVELIDAYLYLTEPIDRYTIDLDLEMACCIRAKEIHEKGWDKPDDIIINIHSYIAYVYNAFRKTDEAKALQEYILSVCDEYSTQPYRDKMEACHGIAFAYEEEEELEMALHYLKQSELYFNKMLETSDAPQYHTGALSNALASLYIKLKRYDEGIQKARESMTEMGKSNPNYFFPYSNFAKGLYYKGNCEEAIDIFKKILQEYSDSPNLLIRTLPSLAEVYYDTGDDEKAEQVLLQCIALLGADWHPYKYRNHVKLAKIYTKNNDYEKANYHIEQARLNCVNLKTNISVLNEKTNIQFAQNQFIDTIKTINEVDELIDEVRRSYKSQAARLFLAEEAKDLYERGIETAFLLYQKTKDKKYIKTAFRYAEKSKAILLLYEVKNLEAALSANIPPEILRQEKDILTRLNYIEKMFEGDKKLSPESQTQLKEERFNLRRKQEKLIDNLERDYPDYYQQKYNTKPVSIENIQKRLADNQSLISYFVGEKHVFYFKINQHECTMDKLTDPNELLVSVDDFLSHATRLTAGVRHYKTAAFGLYQNLLAPALEGDTSESLVIIPDGELAKLPFDGLVLTEQGDTFGQLDYLIQQCRVSYHFSATLWHYKKHKTNTRTYTYNFAGFAPMYNGKVNHLDEQMRSGNYVIRSYRGEDCYELPFAKKEVQTIATLFDNDTTKIYVDEKSSKNNFVKNCSSVKYLHVAAHGFYSRTNEDNCYIQFSPNDNQDIKLTVKDIQTLQLDTFLIVLSCCNTALGQYRKGESMLAVNRSFLAAGAQHVISTIFKVPDAIACELMITFYEKHLNTNTELDVALQAAKQDIIRKNVPPLTWCGYQLIA